MSKRILALLLALVMLLGLLPAGALAAEPENGSRGKVHVIVENTTAAKDQKLGTAGTCPWDGRLVERDVEMEAGDNGITLVAKAVTAAGYAVLDGDNRTVDDKSAYIASINGLAGGNYEEDESNGWMCTLNGWFTSSGLNAYQAGTGIVDGDEIRMVYTMDGGPDVGCNWNDPSTALASLNISGGTLSPAFASDVTQYTLTLDAGSEAVTLSSVQKDKSMQVRTYKGTTYDAAQAGLTRGDREATINVEAGDTLLVVVGDKAWNSYQTTKGTVYTLTIAAAPQGWDGETATQPAKGDGSVENPYQITSAEELAWLRNTVNARVANQGGYGSAAEKEAYGSAVLMNDIDLNDQTWVPISVVTSNTAKKGYTGTFNGNGHTISGLNAIVDPDTTDAVGAALFGHVYGGTIKNLTVSGTATAAKYAAGIAGVLYSGTISDCVSKVLVNCESNSGGITGNMNVPTTGDVCKIVNCGNEGNIDSSYTGRGTNIGGICGSMSKGEITGSYNTGAVSTGGMRAIGGIAGSAGGDVTNCYNTGRVSTSNSSGQQTGGIVGMFSGTALTNCYNTGTVTAPEYDPIVGKSSGAAYANCYYIDETGTDENENALSAADINTARFAAKLGAAFGSLGSGAPVLMWQTGAKAVAAFDVTPADAVVTLTPAAQTAAGETNVFLLTSGTSYTYTVSASGRADATDALETGSKLYTVSLPAAQAYTVSFNVTDENGDAVIGYTVEVKSGDTVCSAGEDGNYSLYAGKYTYTVSASGYETAKGEFTVTTTDLGVDVSMAKPGAWDGTTEQPTQVDGVYQIANAKQLAWFAQKINAGGSRSLCAVLISDIVINDASTSNEWTPIQDEISGYGTAEEDRCEYTGTFDGQGHTVYGLTAPLFGNADKGSMIKNVTVTGTITGSTNVGAICKSTYGDIESCVNYATITVDGKRTGGIAGIVYPGGSITNCVNYGAVTSTYTTPSLWADAKEAYIGGIVGYTYVPVEACANFGEVKATGDGIGCVGGITGYARVGYNAAADSAYLLNCYNTGAVSAANKTGGIVGVASVAVTNCYNTGAVTGGAIIGSSASGSSMTNCYYLTGSCTDGGSAAEKTEAEMKSAAFVLALGEAYGQDTTPNQNDGYPIFIWQGGTKPTIDPNEEAVAKDAAALTVPETVTEAGDLHLTTTGENGSTITWSSNNKTIITDVGIVTLPTEADVTVTLTATVTKGSASQTRTFRVLVKTDTSFRQAELAKIEQSLPKSLVPVYGTDTNVNKLLHSKLAAAIEASGAALKPADITVKLTNGGTNNRNSSDTTAYLNAGEENNGAITFYYNDPKTDTRKGETVVGAVFQLTSGAASVTHTMTTIQIPWDADKVKADMQAQIAESLTFDLIRGSNTSEADITSDITLPYHLDSDWWCHFTWSSENPAITIDKEKDQPTINANGTGHVTPLAGNSTGKITATIIFNKTEDGEPPITITKDFTLTVKSGSSVAEDQIKTALDLYTLDKLTYINPPKGKIDPNNVDDDIQLLIPRDLGLDGKYFSVEVEPDCDNVVVNGYQANILRDTGGKTEVTLKVTITYKNNPTIKASKTLPAIYLAQLTQAEIDRERLLMTKVKAALFDGIKDGNTSPDAVTQNLHAFKEVYLDENNDLVWVYHIDNMTGKGIVPVDLPGYDPMGTYDGGPRTFKSSNEAVITHENMQVTRPAKTTKVTITCNLESERLARYWNLFDFDEFKEFAQQVTELELTVLGTNVDADQAAADEVIALIDDIPTPVTLESESKITAARTAYDDLTDPQKELVTNADKLTAAETALAALKTDKAAADAVIALIDDIPTPVTLESESKITAARTAYDDLTDPQKELVTNADKLTAAENALAALKADKSAADAVIALIDEIPTPVTLESESKITAARTAYDDLTDPQRALVTNYNKLTAAEAALAALKDAQDDTDYLAQMNKTLDYILSAVEDPDLGSTYGEWAVLAEARGKKSAPAWYSLYASNIADYLEEHGSFNKRSTYTRVVLAFTALGQDAANLKLNGTTYDLTAKLLEKKTDGTYYAAAGISTVSAFNLIALDSRPYASSNTEIRDAIVDHLLSIQRVTGAWSDRSDNSNNSVDATAMVLQALSGYQSNDVVKAATDKALTWLSSVQTSTGFGSAEADAQVIVALSALGIDCMTDERFTKSGTNVMKTLLRYAEENGSFVHDRSDDTTADNEMSTEQAAYALVAYWRFKNRASGMRALYDMRDAEDLLPAASAADDVIALIDELSAVTDCKYTTYLKLQAIASAYRNLSPDEKNSVTNYNDYLTKKAQFDQLLARYQAACIEELDAYYAKFKRQNYTAAQWKQITEAYTNGKTAIRAAEYQEAADRALAAAKRSMDAYAAGDTISVTFRLIGDFPESETGTHLGYVNWIETTSYSLETGSTVADLFDTALKDAGLSSKNTRADYVSEIRAPQIYGGYWLAEFDNGRNSGWMYTVNGKHPGVAYSSQTLKNGDSVVFHYIDDYSTEETRATWLRAEDISPAEYVRRHIGDIVRTTGSGKVKPTLTVSDLGTNVAFTFTPSAGVSVRDVKVNGKSVGAVGTYTYRSLQIYSRIDVTFSDSKLPFTDVRTSDWFYEDVAFVYNEGLFSGTSSVTFSPNANMTRAMLVTVLYRLEGEPAVSGRSGFVDVTRNSYYEDAVTWAADNDIVNGTGNSTFSPNANVTREQMAAILYRYAQYKRYNTSASESLTGFSDAASVSTYAKTPLSWAVAEGLVKGTAGRLLPKGSATRAQVAAILHRFVENIVK